MDDLLQWLEGHQPLLERFGTLSLILLPVVLVAALAVVIRLPADYFTTEERTPAGRGRDRPLLSALLSLLKNVLGILLILAGLVLLLIPGNGTIPILIGLSLTNFPGKYAIQRRLVCQPAVAKTLNRIRAMAGEPPLQILVAGDGGGKP